MTTETVSEQREKRATIAETHAEVNPEAFTMVLESDGNLETHTGLDAEALDLHEPEPETMWSSDLGWVPTVNPAGGPREMSRNCSNLKRTKRSHLLRT